MIPAPPPKLQDLRAGTKLNAGLGTSTILPDIDFETYSPAGFEWDEVERKFSPPRGASIKGLPVTGAARYTEHPEAEVLCLAYNLKNGAGAKLWVPGNNLPEDLLNYISSGHVIEAWNVAFEYWVWNNICVSKYNFPPLSPLQIRCAAAKSRAHALPGSLDPAGEVVDIKNKKDKDGKRLINKFSIPRNPTLKNKSLRTLPTDDPQDANNLYNYCLRDIEAESELSSKTPDLSEDELKFWQCDHAINVRGIQIDVPLINNCINILEQAYKKYDAELCQITNGQVKSASQLPSLKKWLISKGITVDKLAAEDLSTLKKTVPLYRTEIHRVIDIREMTGSASVKKLYAMANQVTRDNRLHDLFIYHSARTGRAAGTGPQPQNLPNSGPMVKECKCRKHYRNPNPLFDSCPWCGIPGKTPIENNSNSIEWNPKAVEDAIEILNTGSLACVEYYFGDAVEIISSCLRGMFISAPGKDLICSDYSAIEAVVLAALAGEQWRLDVFNTHGKIYETSASKITGTPLEEYELYKSSSGSHHPDRKLGKIMELALGFQGAVGACKAFGADQFFNDEQILSMVKAWREASPNIVRLWYGLEKAATNAVLTPGEEFEYRGLKYICKQNVLYCKLLSGRLITYHRPILSPHEKFEGKLSLSFEGWNTNPKYGKIGWVRMNTYGGKLTENCIAEGTKVLTKRGWINIENIENTDLIHDGVDFVNHGGKLEKSIQSCIEVDGVLMTPDHKVLNYDGWKIAEETKEPYRPNIRNANGVTPNIFKWKKITLDVCLRVREISRSVRNRYFKRREERKNPFLRMSDEKTTRGKKNYSRDEQASSVLGMEIDEIQVLKSKTQGLGKLWGKGYNCLQFLDKQLFKFLERYGGRLPKRNGAGTYRQFERVFSRELYLGVQDIASKQPKNECNNTYSERKHDNSGSFKEIWGKCYNYLLSNKNEMAYGQIINSSKFSKQRVFDILNCGPRHRFVVKGNKGPFIVHNCVQATARDILANAVINLEDQGYPVVLHVHDEIVVEVEEGKGTVQEVETIMSAMPEWAKGWPVKAKGGWRAKRYNK